MILNENINDDQPKLSPFIACFSINELYYIYDINTNEIIKVSKGAYKILQNLIKNNKSLMEEDVLNLCTQDIKALVNQGYLSSNRPLKMSLNFCESYVSNLIKTSVEQCTLELTQTCNQDCTYCSYSTNFKGRRNHSDKSMSWKIAKKSIDYFINHSIKSRMRHLGFYGGEPLLKWNLLKKCVEYARSKQNIDNLSISVTTNGTLINKHITSFFKNYDVKVYVSLDGPKDIHETNRVFNNNSKSTYTHTINGLECLKSQFGENYSNYVFLSCVYGPWVDMEKLINFLNVDGPDVVKELRENVRLISVSFSSEHDNGDIWKNSIGEKSMNRLEKKWINALLTKNKPEISDSYFLNQLFRMQYYKFYKRDMSYLTDFLPLNGMCIPGHRKIYIDVDGRILICERVSEKDEYTIGHVLKGGVEFSRCMEILNMIIDRFSKKCKKCIFCRICAGCLNQFTDNQGLITKDSIKSYCDMQFNNCVSILLNWTYALEKNPTCFDNLDK